MDSPMAEGTRSSANRLWMWAILFGAALIAFFLTLEDNLFSSNLYDSIGLLSVVAVVVGTRQSATRDRLPWFLIATGFTCFVLGDVVYAYYQYGLGVEIPWPSGADVIYLLGYPLLIAGVLAMVKRRLHPSLAVARPSGSRVLRWFSVRDRGALLDSLVVATAAGTLLWIFTIAPYAGDPSLSILEKLVSTAYPIMDIALLAVLVRLVFSMGWRSFSYFFLVASFGALFIADTIYAVESLSGTYMSGQFTTDGLWLVSYVAGGVAALHPTRRSLTTPGPRPKQIPNRTRMFVLLASCLLVPMLLGIQAMRGDDLDVGIVVTASTILVVLLGARMKGLVDEVGQQVVLLQDQERVLKASLTERESLTDRLRHQAFHDPLTDLANRSLFMDRVDQRTRRRTEDMAAVMFLDIDEFKSVNDVYGHGAGDELLKQIGHRIAECLRPEDTVARLGGDEFGLLINNCTKDTAEAIARRVLDRLSSPIDVGGASLPVRASLGIATDEQGNSAEDLVRKADLAMYRAKRMGKGSYEFADHEDISRADRARNIAALFETAISDSAIRLHYQPIVDLTSGMIVAVEALARWRDGDMGEVPREEFIKVAEGSGSVVKLDTFVLAAALDQLAIWDGLGLDDLVMHVNVSSRSLRQDRFINTVGELVAAAGVTGERVVLEITETSVLELDPHVLKRLGVLKDLGLKLALDDFGIGYSSLSQLRDLPIDVLKMDRSFVSGLPGDREVQLVTSLGSMAERLGIVTVAEGIENQSQLIALRETTCKLGQGYFLAGPAPAEDVVEILESRAVVLDGPTRKLAGRIRGRA